MNRAPEPLPALRPELELLAGRTDLDGQPTWLIHDPLANKFIQIGSATHAVLQHWNRCSSAGELVEAVNAEGRVSVDLSAVAALIDFLFASQLTTMDRQGGWRRFAQGANQKNSLLAGLVHSYLFFRVPLIRPQAWLERTLPAVRLLWSRPAGTLIGVMGLAGLYLASRQWEQFVRTLMGYFSLEGIITGAFTLGFVKIAHELGHAYATVAAGCRVHTMGIAFVVMAPMPYTDVTDAWRLPDRRKRLLIDSAGMIAEAAIAAVALFAWSFLPDGPVRSATFVLSAVTIVSSVAVNLNPFMRFDGYYLLSELLAVENLQSRAFAVGRWRMRELLFGLRAPCPETMSGRRLATLAIYAWSIWIYRLFVFTGIALLVYHYFFKVLGIALFGVEIIYFIALPIGRELMVWWKIKMKILASTRARFVVVAACLATLYGVVPLSSTIEIPAVLEAAQLQEMHASRNARVMSVSVNHGDTVRVGETLAVLASGDLEDELVRARISLRIAELQYGRRLSDAVDKEATLILESTIEALEGRIAGLEAERAELTIVAPFDGRIADLNPELKPGRWVSPRDLLAIVAGGDSVIAKGYVAEADVGRLEPGRRARFMPEHASRTPVDLRVQRVATAGASQIEIADLASSNGGSIAVTFDDKHRLLPAAAHYLVTLDAISPGLERDLSIRGIVLAEGRRESLLARAWRHALGVLIRESGA